MKSERNNTNFTAISYTAVQDVSVQTGGFNAEYGNIRSGLVNVTTKEGSRDRYEVDMLLQYRPAQKKHFGQRINHPDSYWLKPYLDDEVAWTGTENGAWDQYTQDQYPSFQGWNAVAQQRLSDDNPDNDVTPSQAQEIFKWQHRKNFVITEPDYEMDVSFGGPVPFVSDMLGDLRFFASYRRTQNMYIVPLSRDRYEDYSAQLKVTSNLAPNMKLMLQGIYGEQTGTNSERNGSAGIFQSSWQIAGDMSRVNYIDSRLYSGDYWAPSTIKHLMIGGRFTHTLSSKTYYEVSFNNLIDDYHTSPGERRSMEPVQTIGDIELNEAPFGWQPQPSDGIGSSLRMGVGMSNARDSSFVSKQKLNFDLTSQINRYHQLKGGFEIIRTVSKIDYGTVDQFLPSGRTMTEWVEYPVRGSAYLQDKLEFEGLIVNAGLRFDMVDPGGEWYNIDENPYNSAYGPGGINALDTVTTVDVKPIMALSPRLSVSFPITVSSKLYFNYGHFRSIPDPEALYMVRESTFDGSIAAMADPTNPLEKTVAYELGYDQSLFDKYLIRVSGYYKDISKQPLFINYIGEENIIDYSVLQPNSYEDIRGFEATFRKRAGEWFRGFVNYTYMVTSSGRFGFARQYERAFDQREYERIQFANEQFKPVARPYARLNLDFYTPIQFGPEYAGFRPLGDWRLNLLATWQAGYHLTYVGGGSVPGIVNNLQWKDNYNVDMRLAKNLNFQNANVNIFLDVSNLLNTKYMTQSGFFDGNDYLNYMRSLHLPKKKLENIGELNRAVPGDDQPGDFREYSTEYVPIEATPDLNSVNEPNTRALYYDTQAEEYFSYNADSGQFEPAEQSRVDDVLDNKKYIDMPNQQYFTFLNPRSYRVGIRVSF